LARSFDAEFLRYLAGTHHVSEAFKRAGVRNDDLFGCFLRLPVDEGSIETLPQPDAEQVAMIESQAADLAASLGVELTNKGLECTTEGAERLGLLSADTDALVGHVLSAEFHS
jgi:tRNA threonylcarbamoyladenosine modification (KEOPS) complex Cgi121 subunit